MLRNAANTGATNPHWLHPIRDHSLVAWQPLECRAVVGSSRAHDKVLRHDRIRDANSVAIRARSERVADRSERAESKRRQLQRAHVQAQMRRLAGDAARVASRVPECDDIVEAALVSVRRVPLERRNAVVEGLRRMLPPKKRRPTGNIHS